MKKYLSSAELRAKAREQLFGNYGTTVGALLVVWGFSLITSFLPSFLIGITSVISLVFYYLVSFLLSLFTGILFSGQAFLYLKLVCGQQIRVGDVFYGFRTHADKAMLIQLVRALVNYVCLAPSVVFQYFFRKTGSPYWMLLMSVSLVLAMAVSVIVGLMLSQSFYLLQDFPDYPAGQLLKMSCHIMKGHKGRLFYIELGFLPLYLLGLLSCCIAFVWIIPYQNAVLAGFYMDLMAKRQEKQTQAAGV